VNADYPESRKVRYWDDDWQAVLFNDQLDGWLDVIVAQGFDGAYLDIVDAYYFWSQEVDAGDRMPGDPAAGDEMDAAQRMIDLVVDLTAHARETNPSFFVIPQNGEFILDALENIDPVRQAAYLDAIAGIAAEDTYYRGGADENNNFNPDDDKIGVLKSDFVAAGEPVFVVDYVNQEAKIARFIAEAEDDGFIAYPAPTRELDRLLPAEPGPAGPDATIAFDSDMELAAIDVPGATIKKVRVDVSNIGEEAFNEKLTVQYYLSQDSIITPGEDVLVAEKATRFNLRDVGDRKNGKSFNQNISLPTDLAAGTWFLGVMIDTDGDLEETDETNNTVVFADPIEIVMAVGDISDDLRVNNLTLDIAGRDVKFNYKNAGRVDIVRDTGGFNLVGQGSNKKSKLTVVSKQGESTLLDATFLGTMQEVKLKNVLFTGEMTLAQGVKKLTLDDIDGAGNGQASIQIGASADTPWFQLKASSVADLDVFSSLPAKLLKFVEYRNDNGLENVIQIPELLKGEKTFKSKGAAEVSLVETGDDLPNRSLHVNFAAATLKRLAMD